MNDVRHVSIRRDSLGPIASTGHMLISEVSTFSVFTLEDRWNDNTPFDSCIPEGDYDLVPVETPKHGQTWLMLNPSLGVYLQQADIPKGVKGRFGCICAHVGNWDNDIEGCVAIGTTRTTAKDPHDNRIEPMVGGSRDAVKQYHAVMPWKPGLVHKLTIRNPEKGAA